MADPDNEKMMNRSGPAQRDHPRFLTPVAYYFQAIGEQTDG
jgi:hypothetical protein